MSSLAFLVTELQSLSSETRRKHPEIREAAEKSLAILRALPEANVSSLTSDPSLLHPIYMGCSTKSPKVISISLGSLQRLISLRAVQAVMVPEIIRIMGNAINQGVDIQLRILQTLLGLVTNYSGEVHDNLLGDALLVCFKLQESKIAVVASTAAATLRQLVMVVMDKMVAEGDAQDKGKWQVEGDSEDDSESFGPSAKDAYAVFEDLCLLANSERPNFLKLEFLPKTFALELIESVLTNYHALFRKHRSLILLLQTHLCPLILKALSNRPSVSFPLTLRCTRVVFLLLKQFSFELQTEAEVFLMLLIRIITDENDGGENSGYARRPAWMRVLAMEIMRGLCSDAQLMRTVWDRYDAQVQVSGAGSKVLTTLVDALKRLVMEKPALLGVGQQMFGVGAGSDHHHHFMSPSSSGGLESVSGMAGMVANAASAATATVASVAGLAGGSVSGAGLSLQTSTMKVQCIDQLDKADSPSIPESYIHLLALQCIVSLCEGFASFCASLPPPNSTHTSPNSNTTNDSVPTINPQLQAQIHILQNILCTTWPAFLSALSFIISTNLSDELFGDVLASYQGVILGAGVLAGYTSGLGDTPVVFQIRATLATARDALTTSLGKFAVPSGIVSALDSYSYSSYGSSTFGGPPATPRTSSGSVAMAFSSSISENFGLNSGGSSSAGIASATRPGLSSRNLACLKVLISSSIFLGPSLGSGGEDSWFGVLEVVQNAEYVLLHGHGHGQGPIETFSSPPLSHSSSRGMPMLGSGQPSSSTSAISSSSSSSQAPHESLGSEMDGTMGAIQAIQRLFDSVKFLDDEAFARFVKALCRLSGEMVGVSSAERGEGGLEVVAENQGGEAGEGEGEGEEPPSPLTPTGMRSRRRFSGIHLPRTLRSGSSAGPGPGGAGGQDFGITKLGGIFSPTSQALQTPNSNVMENIYRLIYRPPSVAWTTITTHLLSVIRLPNVPPGIRIQAGKALDTTLGGVLRALSMSASAVAQSDTQAQVQQRVLEVLSHQVMLSPDYVTPTAGSNSTNVELRRMGLVTLQELLQASGHTLIVGWETIFLMLESVCKPPSLPPSTSGDSVASHSSTSTLTSPSASSTTLVRTTPKHQLQPLPLGLGFPSEKSHTTLVKIAFQSLTLICDSHVSSLSPPYLRLCISTLGHFGRQSNNTNIALTAAASLLWSVSDAIQAKRKEKEKEPEYSGLWMFLLEEVLGLCADERPEVRDGAIQTLFRTMQLYGKTLSLGTWEDCIWKITFPLIDGLSEEIGWRVAEEATAGEGGSQVQAWDESKILAFSSIGSIFHDFFPSKLVHLDSFKRAWDVFVTRIQDSILVESRSISTPAFRCLEKAVKASLTCAFDGDEGGKAKEKVAEMKERVWNAIDTIGSTFVDEKKIYRGREEPTGVPKVKPFTQESLVAFVDVIQSTRNLSRILEGAEWSLGRLTRLMAILKGVLTYSNSPDYRPDIDSLPPVQSVVMTTIGGIDLSASGTPSLVIRDLSEFSTFPFLAAFDVPPDPKIQTPPKRITYIALAKKTMPKLVDLCLQFKQRLELYSDGTLEAVMSAYAIPIKLKYDCPAPSKHGKDSPLWKTATTCFLRIVKECCPQVVVFDEELSDDRVEGIWRQIIDVFRRGILADCSAADIFPLDVQEEEENFDLALITSLESDVVPHLGARRIPDPVLKQLAQVLAQGSQLHDSEYHLNVLEEDFDKSYHFRGNTNSGIALPRERFSYWCFNLLFLICSNTNKDQENSRKRLAALSLPAFLNRCKTTMVRFLADEGLRGNLPFPRTREDELLYVLRKLQELRLWPGSLWAAFSDDPTKYCLEQPPLGSHTASNGAELASMTLISDALRRSPVGHLFSFYALLCEIAAVPRRTPEAWAHVRLVSMSLNSTGGNELHLEHLDARMLARDCLKIVGAEMGVP
ncbi:hypothetical protein D9757_009328 [Collybiopsis confluens]|uniref:Protein MON2 homolog n=1 Tax=Collybiopsis confluens TaxID=2823264 RepID=A0A8H5H421_9AGAR|nr:hypothetical protein D9757_009328 [Collybiopsis confluens]